jgi:hypothetical protein
MNDLPFKITTLLTGIVVAGEALALLVGLALLTHGYRDWEYVARASNPFCANAPLFVVNNLKLAGLLAAAILGARLMLAMEA